MDFFTVPVPANLEIANAAIEDLASRLNRYADMPHQSPLKAYCEKRLSQLNKLQFHSPGELTRVRNSLLNTSVRHQIAVYEHYGRCREGQRLIQFAKYLSRFEQQNKPARSYPLMKEGAAILGNEGVIAAKLTPNTLASALAAARHSAAMTGAIRLAQAHVADAKRARQLVETAHRKGVVGKAKLIEQNTQVRLVQTRLEEANSRRALAQIKERNLLQIAAALNSDLEDLADAGGEPLPAQEWLRQWLNHATPDTSQVLTSLRLVQRQIGYEHDCRLKKLLLQSQNDKLGSLRRLKSVRPAEIARQQHQLAIAKAEHLLATEQFRLGQLEWRQWTSSLNDSSEDLEDRLTEGIRQMILDGGRRLAEAELKLAQIDEKRAKIRLDHRLEHVKKLTRVWRKGAASDYELRRENLAAKSAEGDLISARRDGLIGRRRLQFADALERDGFRPGQLSASALQALRSLIELKESSDPGRLMALDAGRRRILAREAEIRRLSELGLASEVEVDGNVLKLQQIENRIALEHFKDSTARMSVALVDTLFEEAKPEIHLAEAEAVSER